VLGRLTPQEASDFLGDQCFGHLGCYADGQIYVVPISFVFSGTELIGQTKAGQKITMLRKNPSCCVQVEKINDIADWTSVIAWGEFEELHGIEAVNAMGQLIDKLGPQIDSLGTSRSPRDVTPGVLDGERQKDIVYRIVMKEMTGRFETH